MPGLKTKRANKRKRTIFMDDLHRLSVCNSSKLPKAVSCDGVRYEWVGIGWLDCGKPTGREVVVVRK